MILKPNCVYRHKRHGTFYLLIALTNANAEDHIKFQPMAVYVDVQNRTWSRPIAEFQENFEFEPKLNLQTNLGLRGFSAKANREFKEQYDD